MRRRQISDHADGHGWGGNGRAVDCRREPDAEAVGYYRQHNDRGSYGRGFNTTFNGDA